MKFRIALAIVALSGSLMLNAVAQTAGTTKQQEQQVVSQEAKETFVCPMHADVTADKAGKCPKCGMALEKRVASNDAKHAKKLADGKACEGKAKEECKKNCEGKAKEGCEEKCSKEREAGCAGKH
jgi:Heavy metal binding domain